MMRKIILMVSIAVLAFAVGCSKDQTTDNPMLEESTLRASTEEQTRTALDGVNVVWSTANEIAVLTIDNSTIIRKYTLSSGAETTNGEFTGKTLTGTDDIYALYPYNAGVRFAENKFNFTLPATQTFTAGGFANNAFPMVGRSTSTTNNLSFKNLMGVVVFQVSGNQSVASLKVTTTGNKIAGAASVDMDPIDVPMLMIDASGTTSITLTDVNTTLSDTPTAFYIALPAAVYGAGLKFALLDADGKEIWSKTTIKPMTVSRSRIARLTPLSTIFFPDPNFRRYLVDELKMFLTEDGKDIDMADPENILRFTTTTEIDCANKDIASLKGIEFFTALTSLNCFRNDLTTLDMSKNTKLTELICSENKLKTLDVSKNTALKTLECNINKLTTLDVSQCAQLTLLRSFYNCMAELDIHANTQLKQENDGFECGLQHADEASTIDQQLILWCNQKQLKAGFGTGILNENVTPSLFINFPDAGFRGVLKSRYGLVLTADGMDIDITNPINIQKFESMDGFDLLYEDKVVIKSLKGIEYFTALRNLNCPHKKLETLDVSKNTALINLNCSANELTTLDVSKNTALTSLECDINKLTTLDVSQNTQLTSLKCDHNELQTLAFSGAPVLTKLECNHNQLQTLDIGKSTALENLLCNGNQLQTLYLSGATALTKLDCSNNQLQTLAVNKNTALKTLYCASNQLHTLNVGEAIALEEIRCNYNQLRELNFKQSTALTSLHCQDNQLTALDVSNSTALKTLGCYGNQLKALDVSNNTALKTLFCFGNQLTALDVSKNILLWQLDCRVNRMSELNIYTNTNLNEGQFGCGEQTTDGATAQQLTLWCNEGQFSGGFGSSGKNVTLKLYLNFPDPVFRSYLVVWGLVENANKTDIDINNPVNIEKFASLSQMPLGVNAGLTSLKGIEFFTGLELLYCVSNKLTTLDLSKNTNLRNLECQLNELTALDVSKNIKLSYFRCYNNRISELNLRGNSAINMLALQCSGQTTDGKTIRPLTLWCTEKQAQDWKDFNTDSKNPNITVRTD